MNQQRQRLLLPHFHHVVDGDNSTIFVTVRDTFTGLSQHDQNLLYLLIRKLALEADIIVQHPQGQRRIACDRCLEFDMKNCIFTGKQDYRVSMNRLTQDLSLQDPSCDALSPEQPFDELLGIGLREYFADIVARWLSLRSRRLSQSINL